MQELPEGIRKQELNPKLAIFVAAIFLDCAVFKQSFMTKRHPRTMKIPLNPPFSKGDNYPSLWPSFSCQGQAREVRRDFNKLFSEQLKIIQSILLIAGSSVRLSSRWSLAATMDIREARCQKKKNSSSLAVQRVARVQQPEQNGSILISKFSCSNRVDSSPMAPEKLPTTSAM